MTIRALARLFFVCVVAAVGLPAATAQADLDGGYRGVDDAEGMRLEFSRDGLGYRGVWLDQTGQRRPFSADGLESGAETVIDRAGQKLYMLFTDEKIGVSVVTIPMTEADELITQQTEAFVFIRDGVEDPPRPRRYVPPPANPGGTIDPQAFVESYAFWPSKNVGYGYEMVRGRYRTLIRLHAVVQTDIVWKLCRAQTRPAALADALRGQGVDCDGVLAGFGRMLGGEGAVDAYNQYRRDVETQKAALVEAIRCSIDYRRNDPSCKRSGALSARIAGSLETVATVLERY